MHYHRHNIKIHYMITANSYFRSKLRTMLNRQQDLKANQVAEDQSQPSHIMQCPTSMTLLFVVTVETILVCTMESFILSQ
jgi:hypothetical protein